MALVRSIAIRFARWRNHYFPSLHPDPRQRLGWWGEKVAARFLKRSGYKLLYRRFRPPRDRKGEVDLVCRHGDTLVFVEVKTRSSADFGRPADAVDANKERLVVKGALAWMRLLHNPEILTRCDIVEVIAEPGKPPRCTVIQNAFHLPERFIY